MKIMRSNIDKMIREEVAIVRENISMEQLRAEYEEHYERPADPNAQNPEGLREVRFEAFGDGFLDGQSTLKHDRNFFGTHADWAKSNMDMPVSEDYMNGYDYATGNKAKEHAALIQGQPEDEVSPGREQIASLVPELPINESSIKIPKSRVKEIIQEELDRANGENF